MYEKLKEKLTSKKSKDDNLSHESKEIIKSTTRKTKKEEVKNKDEKMPVVEKWEKNILTIKEQEELETIEKEIKSKQIESQGKMSIIYASVFKNILYAIIVILYFILLIMGYNSIEQNVFMTDLKVFSMTLLITTICIFENAYKKDSGKLTVTGIEFLILSICSLLLIRAYMVFNNKFVSLVTSFALLFAIYYVGKAIVCYVNEKKQVRKEVRDTNIINKKEL